MGTVPSGNLSVQDPSPDLNQCEKFLHNTKPLGLESESESESDPSKMKSRTLQLILQ